MTTLPTASQLTTAANVADMKTLVSALANAIAEMPGAAAASTLTIAAGLVTPTSACHLVDTEGAAASDDLTNIVTTNHTDGRRLLISMVDAARVVTIKHNAGGAGQIALVNGYDLVLKVGGWVELKRTGANWEEVGRSQNLVSAVQLSGAVNEAYATVASHATTADIWGAKGNVINFTGTATVTAFPAAPQAGVRRRLICAGACSFTAGASMVIDGVTSGSTLTVAAGDVMDVEAVGTASFKMHHVPVGGVLSRTGGTMTGAINEKQGANIASASTVDLGVATGNYVHVTGTTTITSFGNSLGTDAGAERTVVFDGALTLTHNATSLILPTGANITTAAGDVAKFRYEGSGNWTCVSYQKANGQALAGSGGIETITAGENLTAGDAIYLDDANLRGGGAGKWYKIDTDATGPVKIGKARGIAIATITSGNTGSAQVGQGVITGLTGLTPGQLVYASGTAGAMTQTEPAVPSSGTQNAVVIMGRALSATTMQFEPWHDVVFQARNSALSNGSSITVEHWTDGGARERNARAYLASAGTYTSDLVPTMTSNTAPSGIASASTEQSGSSAAWKAFDKSNGTEWSTSVGVYTGWIAYEFTSAQAVARYTITSRTDNLGYPTAWTFDGWNGDSWVTLDTRTGQTFSGGNVKNTYDVVNSTSYVKYRVNVTASTSNASLGIAALELIGLTAARDEPEPCHPESRFSTATDKVTCKFADTSDANQNTKTTFYNRTNATRDLIAEVTL